MTIRRRDRLTTAYLAMLYVVNLFGFAREFRYAITGVRSMFGGSAGWLLPLVLLAATIWSLEAIRQWNKRGFTLYLVLAGIALILNVYISVTGSAAPGRYMFDLAVRLLAPVVSPILLWAALHLGSPSAWEQMDSRSLLALWRSADSGGVKERS